MITMDTKHVSLIGILIGVVLWIYGSLSIFDYFYNSNYPSYSEILGLILGTYFVFIFLNNIWVFVSYKYKKQIELFYLVFGILLITLIILYFLNLLTDLFILILYAILYFELVIAIIWGFILKYAMTDKQKIKGKPFELSFFFFLFLSTLFITLMVGKMTTISWSIFNLEVVLYLFLLTICYVCAIFSGYINYIELSD